jgi:ankyrin repeat protein
MGNTAIIYAAGNGKIDCLKLLVDSGGDINVRDNVS